MQQEPPSQTERLATNRQAWLREALCPFSKCEITQIHAILCTCEKPFHKQQNTHTHKLWGLLANVKLLKYTLRSCVALAQKSNKSLRYLSLQLSFALFEVLGLATL